MKRKILSLLALVLFVTNASAGVTATFLKSRLASGASAKPNVWLADFKKAKAYAEKNKLAFVAVWSNGDRCGHCTRFESACNSSYFKKWMKTSGMVFYFTYYADKEGKAGGSVFNWIRKNNTSYPFVRIYWPAKKIDVATIGDVMDGYQSGEAGGKKVVAYIKSACPNYKPPAVKPYTVVFNPNGGTGTMADKKTKVGTSFALPANTFKRTDYSFSGWAESSSGSVVYKDKATVKNLTTVSNGVVNLFAKWTKTTYRTYYVGVKCTITMSSGLKGYTTSSKVPGLKWTSSKYKWTGTPTKAGTYTVKLKKGTKTVTRKIVIEKDTVEWKEGSTGFVFPSGDGISLDLSPTTHAGVPKSVSVAGLPAGLSYAGGVVSGTTRMRGAFKLTFTVVSAAGQKLTRSYWLTIGVPDCCSGTFNGFVGFLDTNRLDELSFVNRGTFRLSAPTNAELSAKVVTAKGTYSFTGMGWLDNGDGTYLAELASSDGADRIAVLAGEDVPPYDAIREIGVFTPSYGTEYEVWAQRAPFARDDTGAYRNPWVAEAMDAVVGTWYFKAYPVASGWVFDYGTSKSYDLKLTVAQDGTTKLAGTVGSYKVSAASAVFVFPGDIEKGFVRADFPVPVTVSKKKKTLDIWTNLWFDRSGDHLAARGEGIGGASVQNFD